MGAEQTPVPTDGGINVTGLASSSQTNVKLNRVYKTCVSGIGNQAARVPHSERKETKRGRRWLQVHVSPWQMDDVS